MLFTAGQIGNLIIKNRIVRSATQLLKADENGYPLPTMAQDYQALAEGGIGMLISGHMYVLPEGKAYTRMVGMDEDGKIEAHKPLVAIAHQQDVKIIAQLNYAGIKVDDQVTTSPLAPSAMQSKYWPGIQSRAMDKGEIYHVIEAFAHAARRAQAAGYDGVQIHAAHGYLISQFLSPYTNHRTDIYGGSLENRALILQEIIHAIKEQVGESYPILVKLGLDDNVEPGLTLEDGLELVHWLEDWGIDAIEISHGMRGSKTAPISRKIETLKDEAYFRPLARKVRTFSNLKVILVGGFRSWKVMEATLLAGTADFVSLSRPLITEPDLPNKFKLNMEDAQQGVKKARCVNCNRCYGFHEPEGAICRYDFTKQE